jgi:hypothetical protein
VVSEAPGLRPAAIRRGCSSIRCDPSEKRAYGKGGEPKRAENVIAGSKQEYCQTRTFTSEPRGALAGLPLSVFCEVDAAGPADCGALAGALPADAAWERIETIDCA